MKIVLGSQSPRRHELLKGLGMPFTWVNIHADEHYPSDLQGGDIPLYISRAKAQAYAESLGADELLITADTIVWLDGRVMGKPHDATDAQNMLRQLSGKTHQVYTGVSFAKRENGQFTLLDDYSFVDCTDVTFRNLTDDEIAYYIDTCHPLDKAGAYGIQEWIGYIGVTSLCGSYFNVMGFPTERVYQQLCRLSLL